MPRAYFHRPPPQPGYQPGCSPPPPQQQQGELPSHRTPVLQQQQAGQPQELPRDETPPQQQAGAGAPVPAMNKNEFDRIRSPGALPLFAESAAIASFCWLLWPQLDAP
jgi:hypothetical protein